MHAGHQPKRRVIDYYVASGVKSVLVLGVLGEADRLSDAERERIQEIALEHTRGRVRVIVGVTHQSTTVAAKRARAAAQAGASAVLRWWQARYNYTIRCQSEVRLRKGCFYRTTILSAKPIYGRGNPCGRPGS